MPLQSDLTLDVSKFSPKSVSKQTSDFNDQLIKIMQGGPRWWEVGAERYRQMRWNGETSLPRPQVLDSGKNITLPSREAGREITARVFQPESGKPRGVFYHIHGGGWVLQSEAYQDVMLKHFADHGKLTVLSVGYRLAPEHPYPAGNEDCVDVAEYLIDHAERDYGVPLQFMGGDSAGGHLSAVTCFKLLETRPNFAFKGLYVKAYLPGKTTEELRDPLISPIFGDMMNMKLPPALFSCGTADCLLDDSVLMHTKWAASGAESILKVYPGAPHGFVFFPQGGTEQTKASLDDIIMFIDERA